MNRRRRGRIVIAFPICLLIAATYLTSHMFDGAIDWRLQIYARKLKGNLPDLHWPELVRMTAGRDRFELARSVLEGRSLEAAVVNPYNSHEDVEAGRRIFRTHCAGCHGNDARGGHAPSLARESYDYGDSDFGIFKVLRDGLPNTAMSPRSLSWLQRWQVIGYLRSVQQQEAAGAPEQDLSVPPIDVTAEDLLTAGTRTNEWLTYSGSLKGWRYTPSSKISRENVGRLRQVWLKQFPSPGTVHESTPLVVSGTLFVTESPSNVVALDARTGAELWRYDRSMPRELPLCCGAVNRGLAVSGSSLFLATLDAYLVALDARTGRVKWETRVADNRDGYTMSGAPLAFGNTVVTGVAGGEYGIRGFLAAYAADSGELLWKFSTIPGPGEPGHETWANDAWRSGGGATWITGSYDAELDIVYWGVGNPSPNYQGDVRPGDNLYTNSVIALNGRTGKLAWHFQFTPHDEHDWDSNQTPVLANLEVDGVERKVICWANRNGFYYVLDRVTGEFLRAQPFGRQNWATGIDPNGRPILAAAGRNYRAGKLTYPGVGGSTNWQPVAFDPVSKLVFVHANDQGSIFTKASVDAIERGQNQLFVASGAASAGPPILSIRALDAATGQMRWEHKEQRMPRGAGGYSGLLATGGGLVFGASGGFISALDSSNGRELWRASLTGHTIAPPISFEIDGQQYIAVWGGRALFVFGL